MKFKVLMSLFLLSIAATGFSGSCYHYTTQNPVAIPFEKVTDTHDILFEAKFSDELKATAQKIPGWTSKHILTLDYKNGEFIVEQIAYDFGPFEKIEVFAKHKGVQIHCDFDPRDFPY
ncbi:MAG: hypothetical protein NT027_04695 [Proteobacteria bacterium]|nr:hypothetical protein [Pseudomonadota bacterium]